MGNKQGKMRDPIDAQYMRPSGNLYTNCECASPALALVSPISAHQGWKTRPVAPQGTSVRCAG